MSVRSQKREIVLLDFLKAIEVLLKLGNFTICFRGNSAGTPEDLENMRIGLMPGIPASSSEDNGSGSL